MTTGTIKVSGLSQKREKQSNLRLAWEMLHKIYHMYSDIKNKEETNADFLITNMSYHKYINNVSETTVNLHDNHQNKFPFQVRIILSPELHQIQPRATQV